MLEKYGSIRKLSIIDDFKSAMRAHARQTWSVMTACYFVGSNVKPSNKMTSRSCAGFDHLMLLKNDGLCKVIRSRTRATFQFTKYVFLLDKQQDAPYV